MKWVAAILLVVNVLIFLGVSTRQVETSPSQGSAFPDVNQDSMRLLGERPSDGISSSPLLIDRPNASGSPESPSVEPPASEVTADLICLRVGPFRQANSWNAALEWIEKQPVTWSQTQVADRVFRSVHVYLEPYASREQAQSIINLLEHKQLDHKVSQEGDGVQVSLGYFAQEELAQTYIKRLQDQDIDARLQLEYRALGPWHWMDVKVNRAGRGEWLARDWPGEGVKVRETVCAAPSARRSDLENRAGYRNPLILFVHRTGD